MPVTQTPGEQIIETVSSWPGVVSGPGRRGELAFKVGRIELGHLHGDHAAHFAFPRGVWRDLKEAGRIEDHPVFPGRPGLGARRIGSPAAVHEVIALLRLNYDRVAARVGSPLDAVA